MNWVENRTKNSTDGMDDGEVELSDHGALSNSNLGSSNNFQSSASVDSYLEDFLKSTRTCTHTHTCNPPGPDAQHTHTCYHTHTQLFASEEDDNTNSQKHVAQPKRPSGNREAVRKYREKKKAHTAYLEEEVKKLRMLNQQLVRKLQGQAILEAEIARLRSLLVDLRGKIENELGTFPFQKQHTSSAILKEGNCGVQSTGGVIGLHCQTEIPCYHPQVGPLSPAGIMGNGEVMVSWEGNCQPAIVDCQVKTNDIPGANGHTIDTVETIVKSTTRAD